MKMKVVFALVCSVGVGLAMAQTAPSGWMQSGAKVGYQVQGTGDATSAQGASVSVASTDENDGKSGVSLAVSDAAPFRGRIVKFQADLSVQGAPKGATIFLNVFAGKERLGFISTDMIPVLGDASQVPREVQLAVPSIATRISYGVALYGKGTVNAQGIKLVAGAPVVEVSPQKLLDQALDIVRQHALNAGKVDWVTIEPRIRAMAADARVSQQVYPAIRALLASLQDHHSLFYDPSQTQLFRSESGAQSLSTVDMKSHGIGYILMPGYNGTAPQALRQFASQMIHDIDALHAQVTCGWIVDLRHNPGGNMHPMLAALKPLLGTARLGGIRDGNGHESSWYAGDGIEGQLPDSPDLSKANVAVLTGPHTASSGEVVAVAFRGRPLTRSFGEFTAGYSTSNRGFSLLDGSMMQLTTAVDMDRDGHTYGEKIQPDQLVEASSGSDDAALNAAEAWLQLTGHCTQ